MGDLTHRGTDNVNRLSSNFVILERSKPKTECSRRKSMGQHQIQRRDTFNDSLSILVDNNIEYIAKLQGMKKNLENNILDSSSTYY